MLGILISCELEESNVAAEVGEGVIGLSVPETELEIRNTWEAPGEPVFRRELGRDPKLESFRLALKLVVVFTVVGGECEAGDVHLPAIVVLADAFGQKVTGLCGLENLVGGLDLGFLLVP